MITKKNFKIAKSLFKLSLDEKGYVNASRVKSVLTQISKEKPHKLASILKTYKKLVEAALSREEIKVESPINIKSRKFENDLLKKTGAVRVRFHINEQIIFGTRITHGDWIWEETLDSKLKQLTNA